MKKSNFFEGFVPNFYNKERKLTELQSLLENPVPCLINIFPFFEDKEDSDENRFSEQWRKGGLGKTMLLDKCRAAICRLNHEKFDGAEIETIELAEQYSTKEDILIRVYNALAIADKNIAQNGFDAFEKEVKDNKNELPDETESDPSYVAERLFDESSKRYLQNTIETKENEAHFFLFFDAFDAQYLGGVHAPLRIWLLKQLFPFLILKMKTLIVVSGREQITFNKNLNIKYEGFRVHGFEPEDVIQYMNDYPKRAGKGKKIDNWKQSISEIPTSEINYLRNVTDGKPIFIDYFSDLILRECFLQEENSKTILGIIDDIKSKKANDEQSGFKKYLINGLYNYEANEIGNAQQREIGQAISFLSVARHGLSAFDFQELTTFGRYKFLDEKRDELIENVDGFFDTVFSKSKLSYVKTRSIKNPKGEQKEGRLLHDEVADLFLKYWYEEHDLGFKQRNRIIGYLTDMYEEKLNELENHKNTSNEYAKLLLEYIEYALMYHGRDEELAAINRLLYEFSYFLDRHPDLSSRLLEKGYKYYALKKKDWINKEEGKADETLTFSNDFSKIFKLRMREAEYCLTERNDAWKERIKDVLDELQEVINPKSDYYQKNSDLMAIRIKHTDRLGLQARSFCTEGEQQFWMGKWDDGRLLINKARSIFYDTGDSHGLAWAEHLLGFEAQRSGAFVQAEKHHINTIEAILGHFPYLRRDIKYFKEKKDTTKLPYDLLYRLRFLIKTLTRATSNWAVNLRYRGKILEAIKILESNLELANIVGLREEVRTQSNLALFYAIRGIESEYEKHLNRIVVTEKKFNDPLLVRRDKNAMLTREIKKIGAESSVYINTQSNFKPTEKEIIKKEAFNDFKSTIQKPNNLLNVEEDKRGDFKITDLLNDQTVETWLGSPRPSREIADLFYQYSKAVLTSGIALEIEADYFEEARLTFHNARFIADKATFIYLGMESSEALYRLSYLSPKHRHLLIQYQTDFDKYRKQIGQKPQDYGHYPDLLAKFYLTEGDIKLENALKQTFFFFSSIEAALKDYVQALSYGYEHNQERYLLILGAFEERLVIILREAHEKHRKIETFTERIKTYFESQSIYTQDQTFGLYLDGLLESICLEVTKPAKADLTYLKWGIKQLVENGKFVKATAVNKSIIHWLKDKQKTEQDKEELAIRYFQQFYSYLSSSQSNRAEKIIEKFEEHCPPSVSEASELREGIYELMQGTVLYRTGELWNMEKFILGELAFYKKNNKETSEKLVRSEQSLLKAVALFQQLVDRSAQKAHRKLLAESLFRLGELYILLEKPLANQHFSDSPFVFPTIIDYIKKVQESFYAYYESVFHQPIQDAAFVNIVFDVEKAPPSVIYLWWAACIAHGAEDEQREADALQSIVNAVYFYYFTRLEKAPSKSEQDFQDTILFLGSFNEYIRSTVKKEESMKYRFPIVISKTYLVEGDLYFSWLFEAYKETNDKVLYQKRSFWEDKEEGNEIDKVKATQVKAILHQMMKQYLSALNQLTEANKPYENYHFNNMLLEMNRRILSINKRRYIRYLIEDLKLIWDSYPNLASKTNVWQSIEISLRVHEVAVGSNNIFKLANDAIEK